MFTVLSDQLALEGDEVFGVSFQLLRADANGRVLLAGDTFAVTLGQLTEATVTIEDNNSKQTLLNHLYIANSLISTRPVVL